MPTQTTTVLGLAGAGLTVAMKDFIVAFFGWFVLMGNNGIRVGDWVEINGVAGEVIEIGLLKTVLLETGQLDRRGTSHGSPGFVREQLRHRRTLLQLHHLRPVDVGRTASARFRRGRIRTRSSTEFRNWWTKETEANAGKAEAEWQQATTQYRVQSFSASARRSTCVPTGRASRCTYATSRGPTNGTRRASELYEAVVELMHGKRETVKA